MNVDIFTLATTYIRQFVAAVDGLNIQVVPCEDQQGVRPNRKLQRPGQDRVIIEHKRKGTFDYHLAEIHALARGQVPGHGTELTISSHETGGKSMILKVSIMYPLAWLLYLVRAFILTYTTARQTYDRHRVPMVDIIRRG